MFKTRPTFSSFSIIRVFRFHPNFKLSLLPRYLFSVPFKQIFIFIWTGNCRFIYDFIAFKRCEEQLVLLCNLVYTIRWMYLCLFPQLHVVAQHFEVFRRFQNFDFQHAHMCFTFITYKHPSHTPICTRVKNLWETNLVARTMRCLSKDRNKSLLYVCITWRTWNCNFSLNICEINNC